MSTDREFTRRMLQTVATVAAVGIMLYAIYVARAALLLIYVSALVAMGFAPLVTLLERRSLRGRSHVSRTVVILAIYLVILLVIALLGLAVLPAAVSQARDLWARLPELFDSVQRFLIRYRLMTRPITLQEAVQNAPVGSSGNAFTTVVGAVSSLIGGVFGLITILILSFYLLIEAEPLFHYLMRFVPKPKRAHVSLAARQIVQKVSAWLRAQLTLAGVMGVFAAIGLGLMGEPYFYVVALVAAVGETIPVVGPIIGGLTAVAVAISTSRNLAITVGIYFVILHQIESNVLVPKLMERRVGVSPVAVIAALLIGADLWGLVGAILAIPTAAILAVLVDEFATRRKSTEGAPAESA